ncbi:MAG: DUF2089 domain-containing protein [Rikenellaceae bacterium]|nr:DUF2089 domain-containing protein [Rikenellaceae bacterium]
MNKEKRLPKLCPACGGELRVTGMRCPDCDTGITGEFHLPALLQLPGDEQRFVLQFVLSSGSLKEMAAKLELSYPTVRNKLDEIIAHLKAYDPQDE